MSRDIKELEKIFENLDSDKKIVADKLIAEVEFMEKTLKKLKSTINEDGAIREGVNGNGFIVVTEHPAQKSYNSMIKNYTNALKLLSTLVPDESGGMDALEEWTSQ